jgi:hypothetical protein
VGWESISISGRAPLLTQLSYTERYEAAVPRCVVCYKSKVWYIFDYLPHSRYLAYTIALSGNLLTLALLVTTPGSCIVYWKDCSLHGSRWRLRPTSAGSPTSILGSQGCGKYIHRLLSGPNGTKAFELAFPSGNGNATG